MFPSTDNNRGVTTVTALNSRSNLSPSRECIMEALEICLTNSNSTLAVQNLIQTNWTATGALILVLTKKPNLTLRWRINQIS